MRTKAELLSLQQLRCFCAALELGSFTAAAEALGVSQPAVAEQIRKLEQALGADLFVRAGRGVTATDAGRAFAEHAARSLRAVEDAADSVDELAELRAGTIALGIFGGPSAWRLDELVVAFLRRHPEVSVRLIGRNSSVIADRVRRGDLEAAIVLLPIDDEKLDVRPIVRDEVLYVSADANGRGPPRRSSGSPRRRSSSTTPSRPTRTRSAASSPSVPRRSGCGCSPRSRSSSRTSRCVSSPRASATPISRARSPARRTTRPVSAPFRSPPRSTTPSRSSPARELASPPACASSSARSRRTCGRWRRSSTAHADGTTASSASRVRSSPVAASSSSSRGARTGPVVSPTSRQAALTAAE